jgi:hypothetical protein
MIASVRILEMLQSRICTNLARRCRPKKRKRFSAHVRKEALARPNGRGSCWGGELLGGSMTLESGRSVVT